MTIATVTIETVAKLAARAVRNADMRSDTPATREEWLAFAGQLQAVHSELEFLRGKADELQFGNCAGLT